MTQAFTAYNDIASWTLGLPWRLSGTVDPWTKDTLIDQGTLDHLRAQNIDPALASQDQIDLAKATVTQDVETIVATTPNPSIDCNNPSGDFLTGVYCSFKKFENTVIIILVILIAVYLGGKYFERGR